MSCNKTGCSTYRGDWAARAREREGRPPIWRALRCRAMLPATQYNKTTYRRPARVRAQASGDPAQLSSKYDARRQHSSVGVGDGLYSLVSNGAVLLMTQAERDKIRGSAKRRFRTSLEGASR